MPIARTAVIVALFVASGIGAMAEPFPSPEAPVGQEDDSAPPAAPNVIVPHQSDPRSVPQTAPSENIDRDSDADIELIDVGEAVAIPKSAQQGMIPAEKQLEDRIVVGVDRDGKLDRRAAGTQTAVYINQKRHIVIQGIDEDVEIEGEKTTRPLLMVTMISDGKFHVRRRYPLSFKTVKPGQSGIRADMELHGGVKAVTDGLKPGTYDVYLEVILPGEERKKVLVCGTFAEEDLTLGMPVAHDHASLPPPKPKTQTP